MPPKKLVVKPLARPPSLPEDFEAQTWAKLLDAINAVYQTTAGRYSEEELYQAVQDICVHKMGANLYGRLEKEVAQHAGALVAGLVTQTEDPAAFLAEVHRVWSMHCEQMVTIRSLFWALDRMYALVTSGVRSLWDMGLHYVRLNIDVHRDLLTKIISCMLERVDRERTGEFIDRSLLSSLSRMLVALGLYPTFEVAFLERSELHYNSEGAMRILTDEVALYLTHVDTRLKEENSRSNAYLDYSTKKPLIACVERQLVSAHAAALLDKGFALLCDEARIDSISLMFSLFTRVSAVDLIKTHFTNYVVSKGLAIVADPEKDKSMVELLLQLKDAVDHIVEHGFQKNDAVVYIGKQAFEKIVNSRENRPAELIAKFVDSYLRSGEKAVSEDEVETALNKVMVLFRSIHGKDAFEMFYKKDLAKRLLLNKSASAELERSMLAKLKTECGAAFTSKLEGMFRDVDLSRDFMREFQESRARGSESRFGSSAATASHVEELYVHVLTTTYWPSYPFTSYPLPPVLRAAQEEFSLFYLNKYNNRRKLTWQQSLGHCVVRAFFPHGRKELVVSQHQTSVLLLFNEKDSLTYSEIATSLGMDAGELKRTLQSLACGKVRVITKEPKGRDVDETDSFVFNREFKAKLIRLKINSIQAKETKEENDATQEEIFQERQYQVDAAIVRIMKTRKQSTHQLLLAELFSQLKFPAKPSDVKKRVESLIDREYLERDESDPNLYRYLA